MVNMTNTTSAYDPQFVGLQFAKQYYTMLSKMPEQIHLFYKPASVFVHGEEEGVSLNVAAGQGEEAFNKYIESLKIESCSTSITRIDAQSLPAGSILVMVTGRMARNGDDARLFVQTFVLAPQDRGFYVHNDIFRFLRAQEVVCQKMEVENENQGEKGVQHGSRDIVSAQLNGAHPDPENPSSKVDAIKLANQTVVDVAAAPAIDKPIIPESSSHASQEATMDSEDLLRETDASEVITPDQAPVAGVKEVCSSDSTANAGGQAPSEQSTSADGDANIISEKNANHTEKKEKRASTPTGVKSSSTTPGSSAQTGKGSGSVHNKSGQKTKGGNKLQTATANTHANKPIPSSITQSGIHDQVSAPGSTVTSVTAQSKTPTVVVASKPAVPEAPKTFAQMAQLAAQKKQSAEQHPRVAQQSQAKVGNGGTVGNGGSGKSHNSSNSTQHQHHNQHAQRKQSDGQARGNVSHDRNNSNGRQNNSRNGEKSNTSGPNGNNHGNRNNKAVRSNGIFISGVPISVSDDMIRTTFAIIPTHMRVEKCERNLEKRIAFVYFNNPEAVKWVLSNGPWKIDGNNVLIDERKEKARR
ncbi:hypothetical protein SARC_10702 [Sphaeroforma arctica JP610]|uniref:NTF2 domain-containing protein n=1 Tax=Sphaeroforma arctica JP610 TaxID=667725 RepID=A0A0L0FLB5_9EUKA|nr:hypothetical protein SARC_10702 [Sphaeroforma arctica JP610]KNC76818.1 hypothetical protein SARC_10702 [Sphaeroforma arctica JP610]|eukprot:XP_014150720.1 hypothetical protein SARC_10702 [Sphaeroforma arctica JP610]